MSHDCIASSCVQFIEVTCFFKVTSERHFLKFSRELPFWPWLNKLLSVSSFAPDRNSEIHFHSNLKKSVSAGAGKRRDWEEYIWINLSQGNFTVSSHLVVLHAYCALWTLEPEARVKVLSLLLACGFFSIIMLIAGAAHMLCYSERKLSAVRAVLYRRKKLANVNFSSVWYSETNKVPYTGR